MERDFSRLGGEPFDLLVIGGGIYGAWTAYDAALRGLRVALVERSDWAAGTSSASSKLIHGGLRYLEHWQFSLVRKSLVERRRLARLGPHRVHATRFVLPVYRGDHVGRLKLRAGLWLYDRLGGKNPPVELHRPRSRRALLRDYPLAPAGLVGGFTFGDCQTDDARFTLEIVDGAVEAGAVAVNHARASRLLTSGENVAGAEVEDLESGRSIEVRAGVTVNCCGPWCNELIDDRPGVRRPRIRRTKGVHLVMPALPVDDAFLLTSSEDGRVVFLLPWYGRTLVGTTDTDFEGDLDDLRVEDAEVSYLLARANRAFDRPLWNAGDVIAAFAGVRTLAGGTGLASPSAVTREWRLDEPLPRLLVPVGGKFTSARVEAQRIVNRVLDRLGRERILGRTARIPLPWAPNELQSSGPGNGLDRETLASCQSRNGLRLEKIFERLLEPPTLARRIVPDLPFCMAEVAHAARDEMARTLEDVLRRRVPLLLLCRLDEPTLREVADIAGAELGWSTQRRRDEVERVIHETA